MCNNHCHHDKDIHTCHHHTEKQPYSDAFVVIDKEEYEKAEGKNIFEDLKNLGIIDEDVYKNASPEEKKAYDELKNITREL
ncbi:MAG: hypothetical protein GXP45_02145 [bacterium]|nr:hypothetical protein [bacterium]